LAHEYRLAMHKGIQVAPRVFRRFNVGVLPDCASPERKYTVECSTPEDAILIAFALDGGWSRVEDDWTDASEMLELARCYCRIIHEADADHCGLANAVGRRSP